MGENRFEKMRDAMIEETKKFFPPLDLMVFPKWSAAGVFQITPQEIEKALEGFGPDKETSNQDGISPPPDLFFFPKELAKKLFDFWVETMRSDKVDGVDTEDGFDQLPDDMRDHFNEAVQVIITEPLRKYHEQIKLEAKGLEALGKVGQVRPTLKPKVAQRAGPIRCYLCDRSAVDEPGQICSRCKR
jgi:hypothetical protein